MKQREAKKIKSKIATQRTKMGKMNARISEDLVEHAVLDDDTPDYITRHDWTGIAQDRVDKYAGNIKKLQSKRQTVQTNLGRGESGYSAAHDLFYQNYHIAPGANFNATVNAVSKAESKATYPFTDDRRLQMLTEAKKAGFNKRTGVNIESYGMFTNYKKYTPNPKKGK